jgi:hypothetical protein
MTTPVSLIGSMKARKRAGVVTAADIISVDGAYDVVVT